jgi:hypothetical protein
VGEPRARPADGDACASGGGYADVDADQGDALLGATITSLGGIGHSSCASKAALMTETRKDVV